MNKDMYNDYYDTKIEYTYYSYNPWNNDLQPTAVWNYGDDTSIDFDLSKYHDDIVAFQDGSISFNFYNSRMELSEMSYSMSISEVVEDHIDLVIDEETSKEYFPRGIYYCEIVLSNLQQGVSTQKTIIPRNKCIFFVN